jgi:predicted nucleic acid-binding protein
LRVLFDTDVILDLLLDREPFAESAAMLFSLVETGRISGFVCATSVTTIHYLAVKAVGVKRAKDHMKKLLSLLDVAQVNRSVIEAALGSRFPDFEDAVVAESAHQVDANGIVTRNVRDYRRSLVPAYMPAELVAMLRARGE